MTDATDLAAAPHAPPNAEVGGTNAQSPTSPSRDAAALLASLDVAFDQLRAHVRATVSASQAQRRQAHVPAPVENKPPDLTTIETANLLAKRDAEITARREEQARLRREVDALRAAGSAEAVRAERTAADQRLADLRVRMQDEIARRDETIRTLGEQLRARDQQLVDERHVRKSAEHGALGDAEARERDVYQAGRTGPLQLWAAVMLRSLPVVPLVAAAAAGIDRAAGGGTTFGRAFVVASGIGLAATALATLAGTWMYWREVGPRWVWFRSRNGRAGLFDVLTSGGDRVQAAPSEFTLEASFLLELIGMATVARAGTGLSYATTEPDAWRAHLDKARVRRRWAVDIATIAMLVAWAVAVVVWST